MPALKPTDWLAKLPKDISDSTRTSYAYALGQFEKWCHANYIEDVFPAYPQDVAKYLRHLIDNGISSSRVNIVISAIDKIHWLRKEKTIRGEMEVQELKKEARRTHHAPQQAAPIRKEHMQKIVKTFAVSKRPRDLQTLAIMLLMRDCMLRRSEILGLNREDYNEQTQLLHIRKSKTDQEGKGTMLYVPKETGKRVSAWMEFSGGEPEDPLFRSFRPGRSELVRQTRPSRTLLDRHIKAMVKEAGVDVDVSTHSFRVGMAMDLADQGYSVLDLQQAGRWSAPDMPAYYCRGREASNGAIAKYYGEAK